MTTLDQITEALKTYKVASNIKTRKTRRPGAVNRSTGVFGVCIKDGALGTKNPYIARYVHPFTGEQMYAGSFPTIEQASAARQAKLHEVYTACAA